MSKRANPMAIHAALSYEICEAAAALGKSPATIRNWIKDGLPVMSSKKPYLISGEALREHIREKTKEAKTPLKPQEFYCCVCKTSCCAQKGTVRVEWAEAHRPSLKANCARCTASVTRMISDKQITSFEQIHLIKKSKGSEA